MKITVTNDGAVSFEVTDRDDNAKILSIIAWWHYHLIRQKTSSPGRPKIKPVGTLDFEPRPSGVFTNTQNLTPIFYDVWSYLIDHDREDGVNLHDVARDLRISKDTASFRLSKLVKMGYAYRAIRGYYRPLVSEQRIEETAPAAP